MGNIADYARGETRGFDSLPFGEVDALVMAELSYEDVPDSVPTLAGLEADYGTPGRRLRHASLRHPLRAARLLRAAPRPSVTLPDVDTALHGDPGHADDDAPHPVHALHFVAPATIHDFHQAAAHNPRFSAVTVGAFAERLDEDEQTQFAAITYGLPDGTLVIAFRGTDDSLVGWKEDFNMAFRYPVPAQEAAADYVARVARLWPGAPMILTGHSKGGNLAVYAAMMADNATRGRIRRIYSLDGPGFPESVVVGEAYRRVLPLVVKIMPDSSIVGMLLEMPETCVVVKSDAGGIMQHFAFSWQVEGDRFVRCYGLNPSSQQFNKSLNDWLKALPAGECEHAVDALFSVLGATGATSFAELTAQLPASIPAMLGAVAGLTSDERKHIGEALAILVKAATARSKAVVR
ncbi:DUF2974 domain-containing protein [Bifidobacterium pullorum subsp. saeculare]|uniref:DUF2974 domain-containing protein n=1 Tax=Bifidobacterium pullorum subsp. saeculare TaxID=78257 RepID=A0A939B8Y3_9BIFI|nr:DUF2974 domain-containing protein [Bifidobacterium pullorum]MBM6700367.1 DUF2974 domain-containing protein [Bifidobacterium pullorum subsp. saeculare]